jgi:hypothetical protein
LGTAGRYTGSYLDQWSGWRAVAILADVGQASLVGRIPHITYDIASKATTGLRRTVLEARLELPL